MPTFDLSYDDRRLRRCIVKVRDAQRAADRGCQLFGRLPIPEIVDVLRGIRAVIAQFGRIAIAFGPYVERLSTDDERAIIKCQDFGEVINEFGGKRLFAQATMPRCRMYELTTSSGARKPARRPCLTAELAANTRVRVALVTWRPRRRRAESSASERPRLLLCIHRISPMGCDVRRQFQPIVTVFAPNPLLWHREGRVCKSARGDTDEVRHARRFPV